MILNLNRGRFVPLDLDAIRRDNPVADVAAGAGVELKRKGTEMVGLCPFHSERTPSFTVYDAGRRFQCFGCGAGGDVFDFVRALHGVGLREAGELLGGGELPVVALPPMPADDGADRTAEALAIWEVARAARGTLAEKYLRGRGLHLPLPDSLRFSVLRYGKSGAEHPVLIALVVDVAGEPIGVQRTYLAPDGSGKADVPKPKLSLGRISGGAIRCGPPAVELVVAGGLEDSLTLAQELGRSAWAAAGECNLSRMVLPPEVRSVAIGADNDATGHEQAEKAARAFALGGIDARTLFPPKAVKDWNDTLTKGASA